MQKCVALMLIQALFLNLVFGSFTDCHAQESQERKKLTLAVLPMDTAGGITEDEAKTLTDRLRSELVQLDYFIVLERNKVSEILEEQGFSMSGCVSSECAVEAGRMLGVRLMVAGNVGKVGDVITVDVRMIDVESGKVVRAQQFDHEGAVSGLLNLVKRIAYRLVGKDDSAIAEDKKFPWLLTGLGVAVAAGVTIALLSTGGGDGGEEPPKDLPGAPWPP